MATEDHDSGMIKGMAFKIEGLDFLFGTMEASEQMGFFVQGQINGHFGNLIFADASHAATTVVENAHKIRGVLKEGPGVYNIETKLCLAKLPSWNMFESNISAEFLLTCSKIIEELLIKVASGEMFLCTKRVFEEEESEEDEESED